MPVCPKCGAYSDDVKIFCPECGNKFSKPSDGKDQSSGQYDWHDRYRQYRQDYSKKYPQYGQKQKESGTENSAPVSDNGKTPGTVSLVFGILSLAFCFFPVFSAVGLITGIVSIRQGGGAVAKAGLIISAACLTVFTAALIITIISGFSFSGFMDQLKGIF